MTDKTEQITVAIILISLIILFCDIISLIKHEEKIAKINGCDYIKYNDAFGIIEYEEGYGNCCNKVYRNHIEYYECNVKFIEVE